jgi:hypothetical protein
MRPLLPAGPGGAIRLRLPVCRSCRGPLGAEGVCWSRRAYRVRRGKGPASAFWASTAHGVRSSLW